MKYIKRYQSITYIIENKILITPLYRVIKLLLELFKSHHYYNDSSGSTEEMVNFYAKNCSPSASNQ